MSKYSKLALPILAIIASVVYTAGFHGPWATIIVTAATALGVYAIPNKPAGAAPVIAANTSTKAGS